MTVKPNQRGIRIRHKTKHGGIALIPIIAKPIQGVKRLCPTCQIIHTDSFGRQVKTVHLYLGSDGTCIVSEGVLADLKLAGMPNLVIVNTVADPPAITLGRNRFEVDYNNNKSRLWKEPVIV